MVPYLHPGTNKKNELNQQQPELCWGGGAGEGTAASIYSSAVAAAVQSRPGCF